MSRGKADWDGASSRVPWADDPDWDARLRDNPDAFHRIIADSFYIVLRDREKTPKPGRRPKPEAVNLDDVLAAVFPETFSEELFPEALRAAMNGRSQGEFAKLVPCNQATISRWLSGELTPELATIARVAHAAGVPPWFFAEWRAGTVAGVIQRALMSDSRQSMGAIKALREMYLRDRRANAG